MSDNIKDNIRDNIKDNIRDTDTMSIEKLLTLNDSENDDWLLVRDTMEIQSILNDTNTLYKLNLDLNEMVNQQGSHLDVIEDFVQKSMNETKDAENDLHYETPYNISFKGCILGGGLLGTFLLFPLYPDFITWGILGSSITLLASFLNK